MAGLVDLTRGSQQRLGWHAAGIQTIAAHPVLFDERDLGAYAGRDQRGDQTCGAGTDHDDIPVDLGRWGIVADKTSALKCAGDEFDQQRKQTEHRQ